MTALEPNAHSALWWVVLVRWDASQCRLAVFQAFGAEANRGTAAASQATNGGMTTLLMNALIICVGGEVGAGVVFMGLWQSFGVAAKQTPHLSVCTTEETHILNTCWLILLFLSLGTPPPPHTPPHSSPASLSFSPLRANLIRGSKKENERKADCSLSTFPSFAPAGQDELSLTRKLDKCSIWALNQCRSPTLSPGYLIIGGDVQKRSAMTHGSVYCKVFNWNPTWAVPPHKGTGDNTQKAVQQTKIWNISHGWEEGSCRGLPSLRWSRLGFASVNIVKQN